MTPFLYYTMMYAYFMASFTKSVIIAKVTSGIINSRRSAQPVNANANEKFKLVRRNQAFCIDPEYNTDLRLL